MLGLNSKQKLLVLISIFSFSSLTYAENLDKIKYKTTFGDCPTQSAGKFALKMINTFEKEKSLRDLKHEIVNENMEEDFFLESYKISYSPQKKTLTLNINCPEPLLRVETVPDTELDSFESILVSDGRLFDPTYEMLLRGEKKIKNSLPQLSIPEKNLTLKDRLKLSEFVKGLEGSGREYLSEIIVNELRELTVIFSYKGRPSSVFVGKEQWPEKNKKLVRLLKYMLEKKQMPATINMTNLKKVVVKFAHKK